MTKFTVTARVAGESHEFAITARSAQLAALAVLAKHRQAKVLAVTPVNVEATVA